MFISLDYYTKIEHGMCKVSDVALKMSLQDEAWR